MTFSIASKEQFPIIRDLAYKIWPSAYGKILSKEQLDYMLDMIYSIESIEKQVAKNQVFLLIIENDKYLGFASYELNIDNSNKTKIQKLYVLPETQGKGIGRKAIDFIKQIASDANNETLILNVNKYNKAKDFYLNYGFKIIDSITIDIGKGYVMDDYVMEFRFV
jgi:ribosomal protein S18 acetylase RimI-like enzyme